MFVDPLAEKTMTPYQYVTNNPIMFTDPTGMEQDDIYLNARNGEVLGVDEDGNNGIVRVIDEVDWEDNSNSTANLRKSSSVVTVNDVQIQRDINSANNETISDQSKERQVYIGLSVNMDGTVPTAEVTSVRGPDGIDGLATISTSQKPLKKDALGNVLQSKTTFNNSGGLIPLGQAHTHNLVTKANLMNSPTTSELEAAASSNLNIPIFAIDSYTGKTAGGNAMHRVNPNGKKSDNIGTTSSNSIGSSVLQHKVGL